MSKKSRCSELIPVILLALASQLAIAQPMLEVVPQSFSVDMDQGAVETRPLILQNLGDAELDWLLANLLPGVQRERRLNFPPSDQLPFDSAVDPSGQYGYFTDSSGGKVIRVDLATLERVDALSMPSTVANAIVVDPDGEYAYVSTGWPVKIVRIDLSDFSISGSIDVPQLGLWSAAMAPSGSFAYFASPGSPGELLKIDLDTFQIADTLILDHLSDTGIFSVTLDSDGSFAFLATGEGSVRRLFRVRTNDMQVIDSIDLGGLSLEFGEGFVGPGNDYAYFPMAGETSALARIDLSSFEIDTQLWMPTSGVATVLLADPDGERAYVALSTVPTKVVTIDLPTMSVLSVAILESEDKWMRSGFVQPQTGDLILAQSQQPYGIVELSTAGMDCTHADWLEPQASSGSVPPADFVIIDLELAPAGLARGTHHTSLCIDSSAANQGTVQVSIAVTVEILNLGAPHLVFPATFLGSSNVLDLEVKSVASDVIEDLNPIINGSQYQIAYDYCGTSIGPGASCQIGIALTPNTTGTAFGTFRMETPLGHSQVTQLHGSGILMPPLLDLDPGQIDTELDQGESTTRTFDISNLGQQAMEWLLVENEQEILDEMAHMEPVDDPHVRLFQAIVRDPDSQYLYVASHLTPAQILRIDMDDFSLAGQIILDAATGSPFRAFMDPNGAYAYFTTLSGRLVRIDLGAFEVDHILELNEPGASSLLAAAVDSQRRLAYLAGEEKIVEIDLATFTLSRSVAAPPDTFMIESALVDGERRMGYFTGRDIESSQLRLFSVDLETMSLEHVQDGLGHEFAVLAGALHPDGNEIHLAVSTPASSADTIVRFWAEDLSRLQTIHLPPGVRNLVDSVTDVERRQTWFVASTTPGRVVRLDLDTFEVRDMLTLDGHGDTRGITLNPNDGELALASWTVPGAVTRLGTRTDCTLPSWITPEASQGSVNPSGNQPVDLVVDHAGLEAGHHEAHVCVAANSPWRPAASIRMRLSLEAFPLIEASEELLDFGDVALGCASETHEVFFENHGDMAASGLELAIGHPDFNLVEDDCGEVLDARDQCRLSLTFSPSTPGPVDALMTLTSFEGPSLTVSLGGEGYEPVIDQIFHNRFQAAPLPEDPDCLQTRH